MSKKRIFVVLGMHRSGTSAIARGLKVLSVELGDNLMPPAPNNNERGFWEDMDIYRFNEKLLAKAGNAWDRMTPLDAARLAQEEFSSERYDAVAIMERKLSASSVFGFKDPRTSVLLPFWKCIFEDMGIDDNYVIAVRNPLEVAESLRKRDGLETTLGLLLWLKYNWAAVVNSADRRRVCVAYRSLMEDPAGELARVAETLGLPPPVPSGPAMFEYVSEFLSDDLRHNRIPDNEIRRAGNMPPAVGGLYDLLLQWSVGAGAGEIPAKLKTQIGNYLASSAPLLQLGDRLQQRAVASEKGRKELAASLEQTKGKLAEREQRITALEAAETEARKVIQDLKANLQATAATLSEREQRIAALEAAETAAEKEVAGLKTNLETTAEYLADRERKLAEADAAIAALQADLSEKTKLLRLARSELLEVRTTAEAWKTESERLLADANTNMEAEKRALAEARETINTREADIAQLRRQLEQQARDHHQQTEARLKALQAADTKLKQAEASLRTCEDAHRRKHEELAAAQKHAVSAQETLSLAQAELADKTKTVRLLRHEVHTIRSSTSWKLTKPVRIVRKLLTLTGRALIHLTGKSPVASPPEGS